jgi:peptidoglycan/LPS O-acetylase OafA/YrhL
MKYRKEIDGLRALAVLPVILFHAGFTTFSGGFVGVDIFFVISGYLITTIIVDEMDKGSFSLLNFYERRARRVLPALFFVMLCTLPFAWFWMRPQDLKSFSQSLEAVPLFGSNVLFYLTSGYFDTASELKPLLHTWSLAVEEQYYVLFPIFLMLAWKLGKKWIITLLALVAIVSAIAAQWGSATHPFFTFYLLPTRGFEILIGALISLYINRILITNKVYFQSVSLAGLALVLYAIFAFDKNTPSPSLYTLIPTVGAGLILVFANNKNIVGKLLGSKLFVGIGLISYSAYLWHQPLLAFARLRSINEPSALLLGLLATLSILMGYLSWKYIENPFRNKSITSQKRIFIYGFTGSLFFISIGLLGHFTLGIPSRLKIPVEVAESIVGTKIREKCDINFDTKTGKNIDFCSLGDTKKSNITLAIFGDSHSEAILPALDVIGKERMQKYSHIGLGGCPPLLNVDVVKGNWQPKVCEYLSTKQYNFVKENKVKNVLLVGRWSLYTDGKYDNSGIYHLVSNKDTAISRNTSRLVFEKSLKETIENYQKIGVNVFVLAQVPQQKIAGDYFYQKLYLFNEKDKQKAIYSSSISNDEHLKLQNFNRNVISELQKELKFTYIQLDKEFCDDEKCYLGTDVKSKYKDDNHVSISGALSLYNSLNFYIKTSPSRKIKIKEWEQ